MITITKEIQHINYLLRDSNAKEIGWANVSFTYLTSTLFSSQCYIDIEIYLKANSEPLWNSYLVTNINAVDKNAENEIKRLIKKSDDDIKEIHVDTSNVIWIYKFWNKGVAVDTVIHSFYAGFGNTLIRHSTVERRERLSETQVRGYIIEVQKELVDRHTSS